MENSATKSIEKYFFPAGKKIYCALSSTEIVNSQKSSILSAVSVEDRAQYIFLPAGKKYFSIDLVAEFFSVEPQKLSTSRLVAIPAGAPVISLESLDKPVSPILQLSGMQELLKSHYQNHRQSFS